MLDIGLQNIFDRYFPLQDSWGHLLPKSWLDDITTCEENQENEALESTTLTPVINELKIRQVVYLLISGFHKYF